MSDNTEQQIKFISIICTKKAWFLVIQVIAIIVTLVYKTSYVFTSTQNCFVQFCPILWKYYSDIHN